MVDYKVPGNDDAFRAIRLFCAAIAAAIVDGKTIYEQSLVKAKEEHKPAQEAVTGSVEISAAGGA
jgi:ribosomal protein S2